MHAVMQFSRLFWIVACVLLSAWSCGAIMWLLECLAGYLLGCCFGVGLCKVVVMQLLGGSE